jgi:hypothetical protein
MMSRILCLAALALPLIVMADDTKEKSKTEPKDAPLQAILKANKATYKVDLAGKSAEEVGKQIKDADQPEHYPPAPEVDLTLELKNTGDKEILIWIGGDTTRLGLDLKGKNAINAEIKGQAVTQELRQPQAIRLGPGKGHKIEIKKLSYGHRGASHRSFWLEPGDYTLTARYLTGLSPAPKGSEDLGDGFGRVTVTSAAVKLKVESK